MLSSLPDLQKERGFSHTSRKKKLLKFKRESTRYLLGCLNSKLLSWYFLKRSNIAQRDDFPKIVLKETRNLPIRSFNFSDPADKARHDKMVELVDRMLELNKQKHSVPQSGIAPSQVERLDREIAATDAEIDGLVYELYSITDEERRIVAGWRRAQLCDLRRRSVKRDLCVEKLLRLDEEGRVVELIDGSAGVLVMMEDLERIKFFEIDEVKV